jgi:large repetitive protein
MSTIPAFTFGGITRPALTLDPSGNIILDPAAQAFVDTYGTKALYAGCPPGTPFPPIPDLLTTPVDNNAAANNVAEGAAVNTLVGITASSHSLLPFSVTYSLSADSSSGGFKIDPNTGVVSVANSGKIDFESSPGHTYTITVQATDGIFTTSQNFTIGVSDVAPSAPVDGNAATNTVAEGAAVGTTVGVTAHSTDINGGTVTYSLTGDTSGGGFTINAATGVITVADSSKIDYESAPGHAYTVTAQASDGTLTNSQTFTIAVTDLPPVISSPATASVNEGVAAHSAVYTAVAADPAGGTVTYALSGADAAAFTIDPATGSVTINGVPDFETKSSYNFTIKASDASGAFNTEAVTLSVNDLAPVISSPATASVNEAVAAHTTVYTAVAADPGGGTVTYALTGADAAAFTIDPATGVVTINGVPDFETQSSYHFTVKASDASGAFNTEAVTVSVNDLPPVISSPAAASVNEGVAAHTTVYTAVAADPAGGTVTYSLTGADAAAFTIDPATGIVSINGVPDFETQSSYHFNVKASDASGAFNTEAVTISVNDLPPVISSPAAASVNEGVPAHSAVYTAVAADPGGGTVTYTISGADAAAFTIDPATGIVTINGVPDFETQSSYNFTIKASDASGAFNTEAVTLSVNDLPPVISSPAAASVNEGVAAHSAVYTAVAADPGGGTVTYALSGADAAAFTIDPATGIVTINGVPDFETKTSYDFIVKASDASGAFNTEAVTLSVNDLPPIAPITDSNIGTDQVSNGAPAGASTGITAFAADPGGGTVTYSLTDDGGGRFTIDPSTGVVTTSGAVPIVYDPVTLANNSITITVSAHDPSAEAITQTFTITVIPNTPPVANDDSVAATEAGGLNNAIAGFNPSGNVILGTGAAGDVQDTDAQDASSALTVVAVHTGPEGGSILAGTVGNPLAGAHGTLTLNTDGSYTYLVNQTDAQVQALHTSAETITDQFNYTIQDTGGLQDTATLTITIHGADDLPQAVADTGTMTEDTAPTSFNVIANDTQDPDHTATNAITVGPGGVTVTGPAGETFANTDATATIVSNQVQVSLNNAHFQQLALGEHATITVPYTLTGDTGETSSVNLVVTVNGVNDVPVAVDDTGDITEDQVGTFTVLSNDTLDADHGAPNNVTTGTVANLSAPAGEGITTADVGVSVNGSNQVVVTLGANFQHMQDGQTATFDVPYTLHGDQAGDTSTATLHVTVNGVNDAPVAANFTFNGVNSAIGNTDFVVNDPTDGAPDPVGPQVTITASLLGGATDADGPGPLVVVAGTIATAHSGTVTMQADGDFTYKPPVGYVGSDSFTYQVSDQNAGVSGPGIGTGTVTINVASPHVWYVNADATTDGDGSSENPYNTLTHFAGGGGVDAAGDTIVLETATNHYTGGLTLENNEQLISQSAGVTINGDTLFTASGANAVLDGGLVLGSGNTIEGVDFGTTSGFAVSGSSVGTLHLDDTTSGLINNAAGGGGISIGGSSNVLHVDLSSLTSGGGTNGISLTNSSGTFHAHGGAIFNASSGDIVLNGGTVAFTDDGAISDSTGTAVSVSNMTGGTQSFTGSISSGSVALSSNTGATISFSGGLAINTTATNGTGFSATGGGTVTVTGANNTINSGQGTALDVENTTIGASNLTFKSITSNGGSADGIILVNTGTTGGLHVTGNGSTAASGGTIANKTGADGSSTQGTGVFLNNTHDVELAYMQLNDFSNFAIRGNNVTGFTLDHSVINGDNGTSNSLSDPLASFANVGEDAIRFTNLLGSGSITNSTISGGYTNTILVENNTGTLNRLTIDHSTIGGRIDNGTGMNDGINFQADTGSTAMNLTVTNTALTTARAALIAVTNQPNTNVDVVFDNNTLTNNHPLTVSGGPGLDFAGLGNMTFDISNNTFDMHAANGGLGIKSHVIEVNKGTGSGNSTFDGTIAGNTIGVAGTAHSGSGIGSNDIDINSQDNGVFNVAVLNNTLTHYDTAGIQITQGPGSSTVNATVQGNTTSNADSNGFAGLYVVAGVGLAGDNGVVNLLVGGSGTQRNDFSNGDPNNGSDVFLLQSSPGTSVFNLSKGVSAAGTASQVIKDNNLNPATTVEADSGTINLVNTAPTLPLLAAPGGVQASSPTPGEMNLTQSELDSVVAAAIAQWAAAGATASQLAALHATTFSVADLSGTTIGQESSPAHITIDTDAAGHGWFVDPTPSDNSEFTHAVNNAGTDLYTDPSSAAAGHLDLLTTVSHELGHVLDLPDSTASADVNDLMYISLVDGERRLPDSADVAQTGTTPTTSMTPAVSIGPVVTPTGAGGAPAPTTIDAGHGGGTLVGTAGADNFVFANVSVQGPAAPPVTHVANYSFAQGDTFDFSALTTQSHGWQVGDASVVRAVEGAGGAAMLQVNTVDSSMGTKVGSNWVTVAEIDGAHIGDTVNVLIDSHSAIHVAQVHVDVLV